MTLPTFVSALEELLQEPAAVAEHIGSLRGAFDLHSTDAVVVLNFAFSLFDSEVPQLHLLGPHQATSRSPPDTQALRFSITAARNAF